MFSRLRHYLIDLALDKCNKPLDQVMKFMLLILSLFYRFGQIVHRGVYRFHLVKRFRLPVPVISVGNVTWGGSGKTPVVSYLAQQLSVNHEVAIVSRGYGHDEPLQLSQNLKRVNIITGKNRSRQIREFLKHRCVDVFVLDDGFQHWPLERDLEIVNVNALHPFGNGHLLPRGILREPIWGLKRADIVIVTHANLVTKQQLDDCLAQITPYVKRENIWLSRHEPIGFVRGRTQEKYDIRAFEGKKMMAVCGIGNPGSFVKTLEDLGVEVTDTFLFGDHHDYEEKELKNIRRSLARRKENFSFVTTEKDWVRCPLELGRSLDPLILKVEIRIMEDEERLLARLRRLLSP
jgi:tetraacyldisaccharide 4'-kinase